MEKKMWFLVGLILGVSVVIFHTLITPYRIFRDEGPKSLTAESYISDTVWYEAYYTIRYPETNNSTISVVLNFGVPYGEVQIKNKFTDEVVVLKNVETGSHVVSFDYQVDSPEFNPDDLQIISSTNME